MRSLSWLASLLLHLSVLVAAFLLGTPTGVRVDLNAPVYQVELFSLSAEPPAPGAPGAPKPEAEARPAAEDKAPAEVKPIAAPKPEPRVEPRPEPKPDLKAIAAKEAEEKKKAEEESRRKAEEERKKAEEEKKRKAEEEKQKREQILAEALKAAQQEARKREKQDAASVQKELDALRKQVGSGAGPAAVGPQVGSGAGGGGGPEGSTGTGIGSIAAYGRVVEQLIKANWRFPSATAQSPLVTQIEIRVAVDGSISGFRVLGTSGRPDYDASAVKAIQETRQLPPPPSPDLSVLIINFNNQE